MSLSRRQQVIKSCTKQVMSDLVSKVKEEKQKYNKRNYAQGMKLSQKDYYYLQLETFMAEGRMRLLRIGVGDEWITELYQKNFKVCRKNSRGHTGVSKKH